jgi:hypothetical protein
LDFLVVGYLLAVLAPQWHLTYGQSAIDCAQAESTVRAKNQ